MRRDFRTPSFVAVVLLAGAMLVWYHLPARIESIDQLAYCACGYSTVKFHDGKVTMIKYVHDTVKPGEQIGTYRVAGNQVEMEIIFNGKTHKETFTMDNIGLLFPRPVFLRYYALNGQSPKTYIHFAIERANSAFHDLWRG